MTDDPRIDKIGRANVLTDTQLRLAFAPEDETKRIVALAKAVRAAQVDQLQLHCSRGVVHFQLKAGFAPERHLQLTIPELFLFMELADRFVTQLPGASVAKVKED